MIKFLITALFAAMVLTSCGLQREQPPADPWADIPPAGLEFTVNSAATLNIFAEENILTDYIVGRLVEKAAQGAEGEVRFIPSLAQGFSVSEDGLTWTFRIREGLTFSNGTAIDAFTFENSVRAWLDPEKGYPSAERFFTAVRVAGAREYAAGTGAWANVGVFAPNRLTLQITLESPVSTALGLYYLNIPAVCANFYEEGNFSLSNSLDFPTSGPYRIARYIDNEGLLLERDIPHPTAARHETERIIIRFDEEHTESAQGGNSWFIYINAKNPPLNDINLRKALYYGLCRVSLIRAISDFIPPENPLTPFSGFIPAGSFVGNPVTGMVLYESLPSVTETRPGNNGYNPVLAREYFRQAFYNNDEQTIRLTITAFLEPTDWWGVLAVAVRDQWTALFGGLDYFHLLLDLRPPEEAREALARGEFELSFGAFTHSPLDVFATMAVWTSRYPGKPDSFFNPDFDLLQFEASFGELMRDYEGRTDALIEMERMLFDFMPAIPMFID